MGILLIIPMEKITATATLVDDLAVKELSVEEKEALLNAAPLNPVKTGYEPLDTLVQEIFDKIFTPDMTTFDKICAIFGYLMKDGVYDRNNGVSEYLEENLWQTIRYNSPMDRMAVCEAYGLLKTKIGDCMHYASACMVMARAIGLEAYIICCGNSTPFSGSGQHNAALFCLNGAYYIFDPVMGVVNAETDVISGSEFFCKPFASDYSREFCNLQEMLADYGGFQQGKEASIETNEIFPKAAAERHFVLGSYPQTRVTDKALISKLNAAAPASAFRSCGYAYGNGEPGSQVVSDYMRTADVTLDGERYRAVTFSAYRPTYCYYPQSKTYSYQDDNGYQPNTVYWFRYEPLEWRLLNEDHLLVCDTILDAQPFNAAVYPVTNGKTINGKRYYLFTDKACTVPASSWNTSSLRKWLNEDFYRTAFTAEEQAQIADTVLKNYGYQNRFSTEDSTDRVFLLSYNDVTNSGYAIAENKEARKQVFASDYACIQGVSIERKQRTLSSPWLLRSPGFHSEDVCMVAQGGTAFYHYNPAVTHNGIRPAIRLKDPEKLVPDTLAAPRTVEATATGTGQITVKAAAVNGAEGYLFQRTCVDTGKTNDAVVSISPKLTDSGLTPGKTYSYTAVAFRTVNGKRVTSPVSPSSFAMCCTFIAVPSGLKASSTSTGTITLKWSPVEGAAKYRIYRYVDAETVTFCCESKGPSYTLSGIHLDVAYYYTVSAVSADGWESAVSKEAVSCVSRSFPARPTNVSAVPVATGEIRLQWNKVPDAARYKVYRYTTATEIALLGTTEKTDFTAKDLYPGSEYVFFVTSETADGNSVSSHSVPVRAKCKNIPGLPENPGVYTSAQRTLTLFWTGSEDAARYQIYRYTSATETVFVGETVQTEFDVMDLYTGCTYTFQIIAIASDGIKESRPVIVRGTVEENPVSPPSKPSGKLRNDVDGDNKITSADARLALRASVGLEHYAAGSPEALACDVDKDNRITSADARLILRMSVGLEPIKQ